MPYEMSWHIEKRVISLRFYADVSEEEVVGTATEMETHIQHSVAPLFLIVDTREVAKYPTDLKRMLEGMKTHSNHSSKIERTVLISENRIINFFGALISNVFNMSIRTYKTMEEAEAYLAFHAEDLEAEFSARKASTE